MGDPGRLAGGGGSPPGAAGAQAEPPGWALAGTSPSRGQEGTAMPGLTLPIPPRRPALLPEAASAYSPAPAPDCPEASLAPFSVSSICASDHTQRQADTLLPPDEITPQGREGAQSGPRKGDAASRSSPRPQGTRAPRREEASRRICSWIHPTSRFTPTCHLPPAQPRSAKPRSWPPGPRQGRPLCLGGWQSCPPARGWQTGGPGSTPPPDVSLWLKPCVCCCE